MIAGTAWAQAAPPAPETEMGRLAAAMQPGEMRELPTKHCTRDLFRMWYDWEEDDIKRYGSQKMFDIICWNNDMKWDPGTRQILVINGGHYSSFKFITYSADTNEWRLMPVPPWMDPRRPDSTACGKDGKDGNRSWPRSHLYDRLAISPEHRLFAVNFNGLYLYDIDKQDWTPRIPTSSGGKDAYQVIEYFPEMKAFIYECNWGRDLRLWDVEKKEERRLGSYPFGMHGVMEYNPVHKVMLFGAGDAGGGEGKGHPSLYLLNKEGTVAKLKPPPIHINCTPRSKLLCDPASGEYIAQDRGDGRFHAFHPIRDEWKELPGLRLPDAESLGAAIDTYGVMMFLSRGKAGFRCHLYKHKPAFGEEAAFPGFTEAKAFQGCRIPAIVLAQKGTVLAGLPGDAAK